MEAFKGNLKLLILLFLALSGLKIARNEEIDIDIHPEQLNNNTLQDSDISSKNVQMDNELTKAMENTAKLMYKSIVDIVCDDFQKDEKECSNAVNIYLARCAEGDCFKLDEEIMHQYDSTIILPNRYQLEAAFSVYEKSDLVHLSGISDSEKNKKSNWEQYSAFKHFLLKLYIANAGSEIGENEVDGFMRKFLFMSIVYYKTYLLHEGIRATLENGTTINTTVFISIIQSSLTKIATYNMTKEVMMMTKGYMDVFFKHFQEYIDNFRSGVNGFAETYSAVALIALRTSLSNIMDIERTHISQNMSWRQWLNKLMSPSLRILSDMRKYSNEAVNSSLKLAVDEAKKRLDLDGNIPDEILNKIVKRTKETKRRLGRTMEKYGKILAGIEAEDPEDPEPILSYIS